MAKKNYFKQPRKAASKYKTPAAYLKAVYKANQEQIDENYFLATNLKNVVITGAPKSAYKMFKKELLTKGEKINEIGIADLKERIATLSRTQMYSREEQMKENIRVMFKKDKFARDIIRKQLGWNKKIDWSSLKFHNDRIDPDNRYYYFVNDNGERVAFKLGKLYKNKKKISLVILDQNNDVATEYSSLDVRGF